MRKQVSSAARHTLDGTLWNFLGDSLALPLGFLVVIYLTRRLGPDGYGLYALVGGAILWVEWTVVGLFSRATIKLVGETDDWLPLASALVRIHLAAGLAAGVLVWLLATPVARAMNEPSMAGYLRLFAADIPLFVLAQAHKNLLTGTGAFRRRAWSSLARWISRFVLILVLVEAGFSLYGAILGNIAASLLELAVCRRFVRPPFFSDRRFPCRLFLSYAVPLFLSGMSLSLFNRIDLFALKLLGGSAGQAGVYGAAQNLSLIPGVFAVTFSSLILSTLSRLIARGDDGQARNLASFSLRAILLLLPAAGIVWGASGEIVLLLFGPGYAAAARPLGLLFLAAIAQAVISVITVITAALGRPGRTFALTGPLVPLAAFAHILVIPRLGVAGAAMVTTLFSLLGASAMSLSLFRLWGVAPPLRTLIRGALLAVAAGAATAWVPAPGMLLPVKLLVTGLAVFPGLWLLGELDRGDLAAVGSCFPRLGFGTKDRC